MKKSIFTLLGVIILLSVYAQNYRYTNRIFSNVTVTEDVVYGNAANLNSPYFDESATTNIDLKMDIHQPTGDTETSRPAIVFAHGGGFYDGSKDVDDMKAFCDTFALKGYVTVTIDYRQGVEVVDNANLHYNRAAYRGLQDGRTAVRFLRANAASYGIDPEKIYWGGNSAGSFIGLNSIFMDIDEKPIDAGAVNYIISYVSYAGSDLGALDIGENLSFNGEPDAVMACWGGVGDTLIIESENVQNVFLIHGTADAIVPFNSGAPFNLSNVSNVYGSNSINTRLNNIGIPSMKTYFVEGVDHEFYGVDNGNWENGTSGNEYWDTIVVKAVDFYYQQHKPEANFTYVENNLEVTFTNISTGSISWLWDFGDANTSTSENPVYTYALLGTYHVKLYIENLISSWDTIAYNISVSLASSYTTTFKISDGIDAISGASITISSQYLTSDASGIATIDLEDGSYPYTVLASGYDVETGTVVVDGAVQTVNVIMTEITATTYTTTFNISDGIDAISGASISINSQYLTSDASGIATIDLEDGSYPYLVSASGYDAETGTVVVDGAVQTVNVTIIAIGINNIAKYSFKVYPNPAKEILHIDLQNTTKQYGFQIIDMTGKIIFNQSILNNKTEIDISNFSTGIYLIRLVNNNEIYTERLIIE